MLIRPSFSVAPLAGRCDGRRRAKKTVLAVSGVFRRQIQKAPSIIVDLSPVRVLFIQHASNRSGSTISGELVARGFRDAGWSVDAVFGSFGPGLELFDRIGCKTDVVPHKNWLRGGNRFQSIRRAVAEIRTRRAFVELARRSRPDIVYVNSIVSLGGALAARRLRLPCIWHIRELFDDVGGEIHIPPCGGKSLVRRIVAGCADHVVLISEAVRENILGFDWRGPASVVPNAADERFFDLSSTPAECRALLGLPSEGLIVGVPGTLRPMKGHEFFLEAAARVAASGASCHFAVTGDGEPKYVEQLRERVASLGLSPRVHFLGTIARMPEFYRACDLVCIPSRAEPFGRTVIEAFAVGVPVAASAVGGICETIESGKTGLLVDYGNSAGMAEALIQLLRDVTLRQRLAAAGRSKARAFYSAEVYQERINRIVADTLQSRRARS